MINLDREVFSKLNNIAPTYQGYPREWNELPVISFVCENNNSAIQTTEEITSYIVYKVDLFCNLKQDYITLINDINESMTSIGFVRQQCDNMNETNGIHIVFRYYVYVDKFGNRYTSIYY